jgi:cytidylate kinase
MMNVICRPLQRMVNAQARRWQMRLDVQGQEREAASCAAEPIIVISRLPGCGGRVIARELAQRTGFKLFDKEILEEVAERSKMSLSRVASLDEKIPPAIDEWFESMILQHSPSADYFWHLSKILHAIARRGRAVILGRGAGFILPAKACVRVLLVAPLKARIKSLADRMGLSWEAARERVCLVEADRRAFIQKHFNREMTDPLHYDIVLNTDLVGVACAVDAIRVAWVTRCERSLQVGTAGSTPACVG